MNKSDWLTLTEEQKKHLARRHNLKKTRKTEVFNGKLVSDGFDCSEIAKIPQEEAQILIGKKGGYTKSRSRK